MKGVTAVACTLLLLFGVSAAEPALGSPSWLRENDLSVTGQNASEPEISLDAGGDSLVAWRRSNGTNAVIEGSYRPAGGSWQAPQALSAPGQNASEPQVAIDGAGNGFALWRRYNGTAFLIEGSYRPAGGSWQAPQALSAPGQNASEPQLAIDSTGDAVAIWSRSNGANTIVQGTLRPAGSAWQSPMDLSGAGQNASEPQVAIDGAGNGFALWRRYNGTAFLIEGSYRPAGGSWQAPQALSAPGQNASEPQLAIDSTGDAVAIWSRSNGANTIVQGTLRPAGSAWQSPMDLSGAGQNASEPQVAIDGAGEATAVWTRYDGAKAIVESTSRALSASWLPTTALSSPGQSAGAPQVAAVPGSDAVAVWARSNGANTIIEAASRPAAGAWGMPVGLSEVGRSAEDPRVQMDQGGDALLAWQRFDGSHTIIQAEAGDAAGPQLHSLAMPSAGTVTQPLAFSVSPFDVWSPIAVTAWSFGDGTSALGSSVTHTYTRPGAYAVSVSSQDAVGNATTAGFAVTVFAKASAKRIVLVRGGRAVLKLHCPSTAACVGALRLVAAVSVRMHERERHRRDTIGRIEFEIPGNQVSPVHVRLTRKGSDSVRQARRRGLKAQLTGSGVKHRLVLLLVG